jgi:hypothetical protein
MKKKYGENKGKKTKKKKYITKKINKEQKK